MLRALTALPRSLRDIAFCAALATYPVAAKAQQTEDPSQVAARALGYAGMDAYEAGDFDTAAQRLEAAYTILRVPSLGLWSARALQKQGHWLAATRRLTEVAQLQLAAGELNIQRQAQADAALELQQLQAKLPRLLVRVIHAEASEVQVTVDGESLDPTSLAAPFTVDPGEHKLVAVRGEQRIESVVTLAEAERREAVLEFPAQQAATVGRAPDEAITDTRAQPDFVHDTLPWIFVGAGGAALVTGAVTFGLARGAAEDIDSNPNCADRRCLRSESKLVNRFNTLNTVSRVGFIGGSLLAAAGVTLWVLDATESGSPRLEAGASSLWLTGTF